MKIQIGPLFRTSLLMLALMALCLGGSAQILSKIAFEPHAGCDASKPVTRFMDYEVFTCLKPPMPGGFTHHCFYFNSNKLNQNNK